MRHPVKAIAAAMIGALTALPAAAEDEENTGQDPTKPLTRVDGRYKFKNHDGRGASHIFTLRADKPFALGGRWQLATRLDLPFTLTDQISRDNPFGEWRFGFSDLLLQGLLITPPQGRWAFAFGTQIIFPTGRTTHFGTGKYQLAPTVAAVAQIPEISRGSFAGLLMREQFSFAGRSDRRGINDLIIQPLVNINLPDRWFVTVAPEMKVDLTDHGRFFLPFDLTIGKLVTRTVVVSLQANFPIVHSYRQYDYQFEARIGFFF